MGEVSSFKCSLFIPNLLSGQKKEWAKETTLERADFTLQLLMFVTEEKEKEMFTILFLSIYCQLLSPRF